MKIASTIFAGIGLLSLLGCGSMFPIRSYSIQTFKGNTGAGRPRAIATYDYGTPIAKPFVVLGKVMAYRRGGLGAIRDLDDRTAPPKDMVEGLKGTAAAMGADAVIGVYHGEYRGVNIGAAYVSGLAVKVPDAPGEQGTMRTDLRVGILPVQVGNADLDAKDYAVLDRDLRAGARWFLEDKGYYAPVDPAVRFVGTIRDLAARNGSDQGSLYGDETDLLLLIELLDEQAVTPVLLDYRKVALKTSLYSKSLGKVIWENQVQNETVSGVFWIWMSKAVTRAGTIEGALKPLPFFSRAGGTSEFVAYPPDMVKKRSR